jgi:sugar lactone lactonase YvrE
MITVAGGGQTLGDRGPARSAELCAPNDVALDAAGNLYVADYGYECDGPGGNTVRKVDAKAVISTVAGSVLPGYSGDGGPAAKAKLNLPVAVAVDAAGNLYIADADNARIRKVDTSGVISTFAGTGERGHSGDGGPAPSARLTEPRGLAFDTRGNLYVADFAAVRKIDRSGVITTVAGTGNGFGRFEGLDADTPIRFAGAGGLATRATLDPSDVAVDANGNLYIADGYWVHRVGRDGIIRRVAGAASGHARRLGDGGPATAARLSGTSGIAVDRAGNLLISDWPVGRIRKVDRRGRITTIAGTGSPGARADRGRATALSLDAPWGLAVDGAGLLYIAETHGGRIRAVRYDSR